ITIIGLLLYVIWGKLILEKKRSHKSKRRESMTKDQIQIKTPECVSLQFRLTGLGSRAAAMIIDQVILTLANTGLILLLIFTINSDIWQVMEYGWMVAVWIIALFAVNWGYFFISEYFFNGKTIGKNIIGIRVIQENGHSITV